MECSNSNRISRVEWDFRGISRRNIYRAVPHLREWIDPVQSGWRGYRIIVEGRDVTLSDQHHLYPRENFQFVSKDNKKWEVSDTYMSLVNKIFEQSESLSLAVTALPRNASKSIEWFELRLLEQFHFIKPLKPLKVGIQAINHRNPMVRIGGGWQNLEELLKKLESEQNARTFQSVKQFTGMDPQNVTEAVGFVEKEIERRINQERLDEIVPWPNFFEKIPLELREQIWELAFSNDKPYHVISPSWLNSRPFYYGGFQGQPMPISLLLANKMMYEEVSKAVYRSTTWVCTRPAYLATWLGTLQPATYSKIYKFELDFERRLSLVFFRSGLGFRLDTDRFAFKKSYLDGFFAEDFLAVMGKHPERRLRLTFYLPRLFKMTKLGFHKTCHFMLCKWIVKAASTVLAPYKEIEVHFQQGLDTPWEGNIYGVSDRNSVPDLTDIEMERLRDLQNRHAEVCWEEDLGVVPGQELSTPPLCQCHPHGWD